MEYFERINKRLDSMLDELDNAAQEAIVKNQDIIIYLLTEEQLHQGIDSLGNTVGLYKSFTKKMAADPMNKPRQPKIPGTPYNFDWTGDFIENIFLKLGDNSSFDLISRSPTQELLEDRYKRPLTKLTAENNKYVIETFIKPALYEYILNNMLEV